MSASRDPLNLLTNPPSTVVKVVGTARDDVNGQLGIAIQYSSERARYVIHMVSTQTTMALKPDNITKASTFESYKAQAFQVYNDPQIRREFTNYYNMAQTKLGIKPEYAAVALLLLFFVASYLVGFTRCIMALSLLMMVGLLIGPDVVNGASPRTILSNFPRRCRETIEDTAPFLKGRLSNNIAAGIVIVMLAVGVRTLVTSPVTKAAASTASTMQASSPVRRAASVAALEEAYKQGFDDATNGKDFGTSLSKTSHAGIGSSTMDDEPHDYSLYDMPTAPTPSSSKPSFGFSQAMSAFLIYRTAMDLGKDPATEQFDIQRLVANAKHMDMMKMGLLGFSCYNIVRAFI